MELYDAGGTTLALEHVARRNSTRKTNEELDTVTMNFAAATDGVDPHCPPDVLARQRLVEVRHVDLEGAIRSGQVVLDHRLVDDVVAVFEMALEMRFPIHSVIPISHPTFRVDGRWSDEASMEANNSSAFNYRTIAGTDRLSLHALGHAVDLNPRQNPYHWRGRVYPSGAVHDPAAPGTFTREHPLVREFVRRGWEWGGDWTDPLDLHHFQKPLPTP